MKRKIILFFTVLAVLCCLFALSISADEIYSDFTKEGADGKAPIFEALGYSVDPNTGSLCVEYSVDLDALDSYEAEVGKKLGFGVVVAYSGYVENGKPLDPNTAKPVGANADKIIVVNLERTAILSVRVTGLDPTQYKKELVLSLFTKTDSGVKYICDDASVEVPSTVSYHGIRGPFEVTINGITYSTDKETNPAADRVKQMNNSAAAYKSTPNANVSGAKTKARLVLIGGSLAGYDHAKEFLEYYLTGKGGTYNIDINDFLSDSGAMKSRNSAVDNALRAAESLALEGETIEIINQTEENHPMQGELSSKDWQYTVGSYFTDVDIMNLTVTVENGVKTYTASFKYIVVDFYNWNQNDYNPFLGLPSFISPSPHELYTLHAQGSAQEFLSYGEITYSNVTWTEGQTVDQISGLN